MTFWIPSIELKFPDVNLHNFFLTEIYCSGKGTNIVWKIGASVMCLFQYEHDENLENLSSNIDLYK